MRKSSAVGTVAWCQASRRASDPAASTSDRVRLGCVGVRFEAEIAPDCGKYRPDHPRLLPQRIGAPVVSPGSVPSPICLASGRPASPPPWVELQVRHEEQPRPEEEGAERLCALYVPQSPAGSPGAAPGLCRVVALADRGRRIDGGGLPPQKSDRNLNIDASPILTCVYPLISWCPAPRSLWPAGFYQHLHTYKERQRKRTRRHRPWYLSGQRWCKEEQRLLSYTSQTLAVRPVDLW